MQQNFQNLENFNILKVLFHFGSRFFSYYFIDVYRIIIAITTIIYKEIEIFTLEIKLFFS